jgi:hypothetical protein
LERNGLSIGSGISVRYSKSECKGEESGIAAATLPYVRKMVEAMRSRERRVPFEYGRLAIEKLKLNTP